MPLFLLLTKRQVDAVVYLVDAYDRERFAESKRELDALLSDEALASAPFLVLGNKIDLPYAASEEELRYSLGLTNFTTGKGKVDLTESNVRPLEVFMCSIVRKMGYGEGFKWMSQYIKWVMVGLWYQTLIFLLVCRVWIGKFAFVLFCIRMLWKVLQFLLCLWFILYFSGTLWWLWKVLQDKKHGTNVMVAFSVACKKSLEHFFLGAHFIFLDIIWISMIQYKQA